MAQKRNLNVNPYFDDFDRDKNFYKVLFKPGFPVQARELTTLQSVLQNQLEQFGNNIFKDGSMVIPGGVTFDPQFYAVKLDAVNSGVDVSVYIKEYIGKTITGLESGITAQVKYVALPGDPNIDDLTIYVKYLSSGGDNAVSQFLDGEALLSNENVVYGNTTINAGTTFASLLNSNATSNGVESTETKRVRRTNLLPSVTSKNVRAASHDVTSVLANISSSFCLYSYKLVI